MIFLLPKGKGGYRGIVLVEVLCKMCSVVVNCSLKRSVVLHNALHGFIEGRGTGKVTLEANLAHQMDNISHEPLFQVFLYLHKAYGSLDR